MAASRKVRSFSSEPRESRESEEEESDTVTMFEVFHWNKRERIVLQRLIVIARLPQHLADRTELGAHYERLNFQLTKQYIWDHMTGLLLIYPSCLLHVIESSREVLVPVLKDLEDIQQQPDRTLLEAPKVVFMAHNPRGRLFQQWSYKVLSADQGPGDTGVKGLEEEDESTETLVCSVLSALQKLGEHLETSKALPGSVLDEAPELIVSQEVLDKLLARDDLQTPRQHLQMYDSPLNISMDFGKKRLSVNLGFMDKLSKAADSPQFNIWTKGQSLVFFTLVTTASKEGLVFMSFFITLSSTTHYLHDYTHVANVFGLH